MPAFRDRSGHWFKVCPALRCTTTGGRHAKTRSSSTSHTVSADDGASRGATGNAASLTTVVRRAVVVVAIVLIASVLTFTFGSASRYERFALFNGAVVASAIYAGAPGGLFATIAGILVVEYRWLPPRGALEFGDLPTTFAVVVFTLVSLVITGLAVRVRTQSSRLRAARDAAMVNEERRRLLAEAGRILASSLDYETTVSSAARLAVPDFADWCAVDLLIGDDIKHWRSRMTIPKRQAGSKTLV